MQIKKCDVLRQVARRNGNLRQGHRQHGRVLRSKCCMAMQQQRKQREVLHGVPARETGPDDLLCSPCTDIPCPLFLLCCNPIQSKSRATGSQIAAFRHAVAGAQRLYPLTLDVAGTWRLRTTPSDDSPSGLCNSENAASARSRLSFRSTIGSG